jgi:hypothetical protein
MDLTPLFAREVKMSGAKTARPQLDWMVKDMRAVHTEIIECEDGFTELLLFVLSP